jgi:N-methylhydantoinase A/oxoprolinase/acetone carboxylase beta subunit
MPDLASIALGGGGLVGFDPLRIGPRSVGHGLLTEARVFGGPTLTMTDVAVAGGRIALGDARAVADLGRANVETALSLAQGLIEGAIDRMKLTKDDVTLIAVGGGAFLVPDRLAGVGRIVRVPFGDCANAVGAAIAQVSGEIDRIYRDQTRADAIAAAKRAAEERALAAGAAPETLKTVEVEDMPLAYLPGNALRVRARVVGDVASGAR